MLAAAAASNTRFRSRSKVLLLSLGSLSGTGRSLLGACTADRPVGCDARRRSCVGYALDHSFSCSPSEAGAAQAARCSALAPLIAQSGVTLAAAAASAALSIVAAALALRGLGGSVRSLLGACTADRPVGCDARRRSCVGYALDHSCSCSPSEAGAAQAARCSARAPLIAQSGVTLAAAAASAALSIVAAALALRGLSGSVRSLLGACTADRPVGCDARRRGCVGYALDQCSLGGLSGTGRSLLGACTADRPVGCEVRHRSCVGCALDRSCSCSLSEA
jgi:hypothetical protein